VLGCWAGVPGDLGSLHQFQSTSNMVAGKWQDEGVNFQWNFFPASLPVLV